MRIDTQLVHEAADGGDPHGATAPPLYQTATFAQPSAVDAGQFDYTRSGNPTRLALEGVLAALEGGGRAFAFTSGMAALAAVARLVRPGERIVAGSDVYGGTFRLLAQCLDDGVAVDWVPAHEPGAVARALGPATRLCLVETPSNPLQRIVDLEEVAAACRARGTLLAVDGTLLSPYLQKPLEHGADLVVHSATKHLGGHGDLTAGVVVARGGAVADRIGFRQNAEGTGLAPFESWLLLRGLKTLGVRLERQQANARRIAAFLDDHPAVRRVHYAGLKAHPGRAGHDRQARGPGSVVSFETGSVERSRAAVERTELFRITVSFGCVSSSISLPCRMSHASIPARERRARALPEDLVRISVGLEDPGDLVADLGRALSSAVPVSLP